MMTDVRNQPAHSRRLLRRCASTLLHTLLIAMMSIRILYKYQSQCTATTYYKHRCDHADSMATTCEKLGRLFGSSAVHSEIAVASFAGTCEPTRN
mmetsp:Transcript_9208/g.24292  ORF Transcript_9208/g.24292 Transcript_9208/m.24292 type:complete len:95 (-) Transcript_9208:16-300(-)